MSQLEKNSFILYTEYAEEISLLSDQEAGAFIKAVFAYESGAEIPDLSGGARLLFSIVKRRLDENREKYIATCEARKESGRKGGEASGKARKQANASLASGECSPNEANEAKASFASSEPSKTNQNEHDTELELDTDTEGQEIKGKSGMAAAKAGRAKNVPEYSHNSHAYKAAVYLDKQMCARLSGQKAAEEKRLQAWALEFDRCNRLDGHSWEDIGQVLRFSQRDPFWQANILSGGKFREKYVQLLAKMQQGVEIRGTSHDISELEAMSSLKLPKNL